MNDTSQEPNATACDMYEIDLHALFLKWLGWWRPLLAFATIGAIAAFAYTRTLPREYKSSSMIYVQQNSGAAGLLKDLPVPISGGGTGSIDYLFALISSHSMAEKITRQLSLDSNPDFRGRKPVEREKLLGLFEKRVSAAKDKTGTIQITAQTYNPELSARIANAVVDALGTLVVNSSRKKSDFVAVKLERTSEDMREAEDKLKSFQQKNDIASIDEQTKALVLELSDLDAKMLETQVQLQDVSSQLANAAELNSLVDLDVRRKSLESTKSMLAGRREQLQGKLSSLPAVGLTYMRLQRNVSVLEKTYELLTQQYQMAQISLRGEDGDYQVIDRAVPIHKKVAPSGLKNCILGAMAGFFVALGALSLSSSPSKKNRKRLRLGR
ncbi:MAG: GumC family protein [Armatimonadota bacterium]